MQNLRSKLIRLAHDNPELRADILPLLAQAKQAATDPKLDPAVLAEVKQAVAKMTQLAESMKPLIKKLEKKHDLAEDEYKEKLKELGEDDAGPYQTLQKQYNTLFLLFDTASRKLEDDADQLEREVEYAKRLR